LRESNRTQETAGQAECPWPSQGIREAMKHPILKSLKPFLLEVLVYTALIAIYYLLVLHLLGPSLMHLYQHDRRLYAALALGLIAGQGLWLEVLTRLLLSWIAPRTEDG
jgi:hypothetical protein